MSNNVSAHVMLCGNAKLVIKQVRNSYFILSYFILSYFILLYFILSYFILSFFILSYFHTSYFILSFSSCVIVCMRIIIVVLILMESGGLD